MVPYYKYIFCVIFIFVVWTVELWSREGINTARVVSFI